MTKKQITTINGLKVEFQKQKIVTFFARLQFPLAIIDFETFRLANNDDLVFNYQHHDFINNIFSVAIVVINNMTEITTKMFKIKHNQLFCKTSLPKDYHFNNFDNLANNQTSFFHFLIKKLIKKQIKSIVLLGSYMETTILKNYLIYLHDLPQYQNLIRHYFQDQKIFDLYDLWNRDEIISLPDYKSSHNEVGATKKTNFLIKENSQYQKYFVKQNAQISNYEVGRIVDQHFNQNICLLDNFLPLVKKHNKIDVVIGKMILHFLWQLTN